MKDCSQMDLKETPCEIALAYVDIITELIFIVIFVTIALAVLLFLPKIPIAFYVGGAISTVSYFILQIWKPVVIVWHWHYRKELPAWLRPSIEQQSAFGVVDTLKSSGNKSLLDD